MTRHIHGLCTVLLLVVMTGCHGYLRTGDHRPLPMVAAETVGGDQLVAFDGNLLVRAGEEDIGAMLGVRLEESESGVVVAEVRRQTKLEAGDRVTSVELLFPPPPLADEADREEDPRSSARAPARGPRHAVRSLDDLRGYTSCEGWAVLALEVQRAGGVHSVLQPVFNQAESIPFTRFDPGQVFRANGLELCLLDDWPDGHMPRHGDNGLFMVTRVDAYSRAARAGIRPLDVILADIGQVQLLGATWIRRRDGSEHPIELGPHREPTDFWVPFLVSYERDAMRTHLGIGPLDLLFHYSRGAIHDADRDAFLTIGKWSFLTLFQGLTYEGPGGGTTYRAIDAMTDMARQVYLRECTVDGLEPDPSRDWPVGIDFEKIAADDGKGPEGE